MKIILPEDVKKIIEILHAHGAEGYAVGGCVRDVFLGREPKDWDITTSASPEEVKSWFYKTIDTGIQHGTVTVMMHRVGYEVTTYRIDGVYTDSRHPESVTFTKNIAEDLKRRDFTINAMAYNEQDGVVDLFGGQEDLKAQVIRAVGNAEERFTEDALRIMRCIRFAAQLGFEIEPETWKAAEKLAPNLKNISRERVREELMKTLCSDHPEKLVYFSEIGAMREICPVFDPEDTHMLSMLKMLPADKELRLAALLLHGRGDASASAEEADRILKNLRFDNDTKRCVVHLIRHRDEKLSDDACVVRHTVSAVGKEAFPMWLTLAEADRNITFPFVRALYEEITEKGICTSVGELAVTGNDLIAFGVPRGRMIGETLSRLLACVLDEPKLNTYECLKDLAISEKV